MAISFLHKQWNIGPNLVFIIDWLPHFFRWLSSWWRNVKSALIIGLSALGKLFKISDEQGRKRNYFYVCLLNKPNKMWSIKLFRTAAGRLGEARRAERACLLRQPQEPDHPVGGPKDPGTNTGGTPPQWLGNEVNSLGLIYIT